MQLFSRPILRFHLLTLLILQQQPLTSSQSIQGFIYWDADFNGILSEGILNPFGIYLRELEYGIVGVEVEVFKCGDGGGEPIAKTASTWPSATDKVSSSSTNIHAKAGYYKLDVRECILKNDHLIRINSGVKSAAEGIGCYLSIASPKDYEITTTFPLPYSHGFYVKGVGNARSEELNSIKDSVFTWRAYKDTGLQSTDEQPNPKANVINRGYQARTSECFGHTDNGEWYVWKDLELIDEGSDISSKSNSSFFEPTSANKAIQVPIPNTNMFGYDRYLTSNSYNYEGVLSIAPVGMKESMWPLPLRVKADVYLGLNFRSNNNGPLQGRFMYESVSQEDAVSASAYNSELSLDSSVAIDSSVSVSANGSDVSISNGLGVTDKALDNPSGILSNIGNLEAVIHKFLKEKVLSPSRDVVVGQDEVMVSLNVVALNHWSLVKVTDSQEELRENRLRHHLSLHGVPIVDDKNGQGGSPPPKSDSNLHIRRKLTQQNPHLLFHFQIYGTYKTRSASTIQSIIQTTNDFGIIVERAINEEKEVLIKSIRGRTFDEKCIKSDSGSDGESTYNIIEIGSDASTTLSCEDLLPPYFNDVSSLDCRGETNYDADLTEEVELSSALKFFKSNRQTYTKEIVDNVEEEEGTGLWVYIVISVISGIVLAACSVGWVVNERKRRAKLRNEKLMLKEQRKAEKKAKKKLSESHKSVAGLEKNQEGTSNLEKSRRSDKSKSCDELYSSDDDDDEELGRLFDKSTKTTTKMDLETKQSNGQNLNKSQASDKNQEGISSLEESHKSDKSKSFDELYSSDDDDDEELGRLFDKSTKTTTTIGLEQSNLSVVLDAKACDYYNPNRKKSELVSKSRNVEKKTKDRVINSSNEAKTDRRNRLLDVMSSLRRSTTDKILGKCDVSSDGFSSDSDRSRSSSSSSGKEAEHVSDNRKKILASAIRSSLTRIRTQSTERNVDVSARNRKSHKSGAHATTSSTKKKRTPSGYSSSSSDGSSQTDLRHDAAKVPSSHDEVDSDGSSSSSNSSSGSDTHPETMNGIQSSLPRKYPESGSSSSSDDNSSSSNSSSDGEDRADTTLQKAFGRPSSSRRLGDRSLSKRGLDSDGKTGSIHRLKDESMSKRDVYNKSEPNLKRHSHKPSAYSYTRRQSLPETNIRLQAHEPGVSKLSEQLRLDGAAKHTNTRLLMTKNKSERLAERDVKKSHDHVYYPREHPMPKYALKSKSLRHIPLHELKPSKSTRHVNRESSTRVISKDQNLQKRQSTVKTKSSRNFKAKMEKDKSVKIRAEKSHARLVDSVDADKAACLPQDLKLADTQKDPHHTTCKHPEKFESSNCVERSSDSRTKSRLSSVANDSSHRRINGEGKDNRKSRKSTVRKDTHKKSNDAQATNSRHQDKEKRRRATFQGLNELTSSLKSSFKGIKLSGAATSALEGANGANNAHSSDKETSKAPSRKSSHSAMVSERSSSRLKTKSSHKHRNGGTKKNTNVSQSNRD